MSEAERSPIQSVPGGASDWLSLVSLLTLSSNVGTASPTLFVVVSPWLCVAYNQQGIEPSLWVAHHTAQPSTPWQNPLCFQMGQKKVLVLCYYQSEGNSGSQVKNLQMDPLLCLVSCNPCSGSVPWMHHPSLHTGPAPSRCWKKWHEQRTDAQRITHIRETSHLNATSKSQARNKQDPFSLLSTNLVRQQ